MVKTRRPKSDKPLVPLGGKVSKDLKDLIIDMSETEDRSVSYILERLLTSHPDISPTLQRLRQSQLKLAA